MDLRNYLDQMGVQYAWRHHDVAYTAQDLAMREHISGRSVVKPVMVAADGQMVLCALPASSYIDMEQLREELHAQVAELANEHDFSHLFGDCETGAEPPIGELYGLPTVMDDSLMRAEQLTFQAGTHCDAVTISTRDYMRLAHPTIGHFGKNRA